MTTTQARPRGRPRDPSVDVRILAATRAVVSEVGVWGASMSAIADRAGCGKPSLYLRWPNLPALIRAALDDLAIDDMTFALLSEAEGTLEFLRDQPHGLFLIEAVLLPSAAGRVGS